MATSAHRISSVLITISNSRITSVLRTSRVRWAASTPMSAASITKPHTYYIHKTYILKITFTLTSPATTTPNSTLPPNTTKPKPKPKNISISIPNHTKPKQFFKSVKDDGQVPTKFVKHYPVWFAIADILLSEPVATWPQRATISKFYKSATNHTKPNQPIFTKPKPTYTKYVKDQRENTQAYKYQRRICINKIMKQYNGNTNNDLKIISWNKGAKLLSNKLDVIRQLLIDKKPHVIVLQEAQIIGDINNFNIDGYNLLLTTTTS